MRWLENIYPNEEESIYMDLFAIAEPTIDWLQAKSIEAAECGRETMYEKYVEAGNMLLLAIPYFSIVRKKYKTLDYDPCNDTYDITLECMLDKIRCVSAGVNKNLVTPFEQMIEAAKLGPHKENKCSVKVLGDYDPEDYNDSFYKT